MKKTGQLQVDRFIELLQALPSDALIVSSRGGPLIVLDAQTKRVIGTIDFSDGGSFVEWKWRRSKDQRKG
jgi:hypothetical protein